MTDRCLAASAALVLLLAASLHAEDWPSWRGPTGMGQSKEKELPLTWGGKDGSNILWKSPLVEAPDKVHLDHNQSSPIVMGDRVFVTLSYWPAGKTNKEYSEHHVICFDKKDGKRLWDAQVQPGGWQLNDFRGGGYACPTPAADAERVYVVFGSAVVAAIDNEGKLVWRKEIDPKNYDVTIGSSPILFGDTVLVINDKNARASTLIAFDRKTGDVKWEQKRPDAGFAHSTPVLAEVGGKTQLLVAASNAMQGLDPATGKVLWTCAAKGDTASPVLGAGLVFVDSGRGGTGTAADPTGSGEVTKSHTKWKKDVPEGYSSPIVVGDYLYRLHNPGVVTCWKLATGEQVYRERLPGITTTSASPIATPDGRLYFASAGKSVVIQAGPKFEILATNDLGDACHASPAISDGKIYLKGMKHLYCVGKPRTK
jgi:outer membrane protein assembly factor BamB